MYLENRHIKKSFLNFNLYRYRYLRARHYSRLAMRLEREYRYDH